MTRNAASWDAIATLIERVVALPSLMDELVAEVRGSVTEVAALESSDVSRHTRALIAAATRAVAARRGPTAEELSFVEELAATRAQQGVPIHAVLSAIEVAQRGIWIRARRVAAEDAVDPDLLLDARELYDDWALQVRERLLEAYRRTEPTAAMPDRDAKLVGRLLQGGTTAALAAESADLPDDGLWVAVAGADDAADVAQLVRSARAGYVAVDAGDTVAVLKHLPAPWADTGAVTGGTAGGTAGDTAGGTAGDLVVLAGPGAPADLHSLRQTASAGAHMAGARGLGGVHRLAGVAALAALDGRDDLVAAVADHYGPLLESLGSRAVPDIATTRTWLEHRCDASVVAEAEYVHPNTVRNRVARVAEAVGLDPEDPFQAVTLWLLCRQWQARAA